MRGIYDKAIHLDRSPRSLSSLAMTKVKKLGFALVELAIVLVIIGLLVGGILTGQSLIKSVSLKQQIREWSQLEIAINTYKTKYERLPGDDDPTLGNNNGKINYSYALNYSEPCVMFNSLAYEGFSLFPTINNCSSGVALPVQPGKTVPLMKFGRIKKNTTYTLTSEACTRDGTCSPNTYILTCQSDENSPNYFRCGTVLSGDSRYPITNEQAQAIDSKMDDGLPLNGEVLSHVGLTRMYETDGYDCATYTGGGGIGPNTTAKYNLSGSLYFTSANGLGCALMIKLNIY